MDILDALALVERYLDCHIRADYDSYVVVVEFENDWAFHYNTSDFLSGGDIWKSIVGVGPLVVPKDGSLASYLRQS